jgi:hypothetical protein
MGPVTAIVPHGGGQPRQQPSAGAQAALSGAAAMGRALIPLAPDGRGAGPSVAGRGLSAAFLAQLIAADCNLPQARERRRAEPGVAVSAYAATARL